jgi:FHA domain
MKRAAIELNASTLHGVIGARGTYPQPLAPDHDGIPLVVSLERSTPEVGHAALAVAREKAHAICRGFVPHVGLVGPKMKKWHVDRHRLDADAAMSLVCAKLQPLAKSATQMTAALPAYLSPDQAAAIHRLAKKAKLPLVGSLSTPLAAALVGYAEQAWTNSAVIVDLDDHALTLAHVCSIDGHAEVGETRIVPALALSAWKERLLNSLADVCVWQTRRDPRDTPHAEQHLFDQIDALLEATLQGRTFQIGIKGSQWYQNLLVTPDQTIHFAGQLLRTLRTEVDRFLDTFHDEAPTFLLTHTAARIPGFVAYLRERHEVKANQAVTTKPRPKTALEDFGEDLVEMSGHGRSGVVLLTPDAIARGAHILECEPGVHSDEAVPLPLPLPLEAGPARLLFQGQNHYLTGTPFGLGSHGGCQLMLDAMRYPGVSARHCEIVFERRAFVLTNRSREGTLVNDGIVHHSIVLQAGDWIRLGPQGPQVRLLGQDPAPAAKSTSA